MPHKKILAKLKSVQCASFHVDPTRQKLVSPEQLCPSSSLTLLP
uniref:Uncharacterized protein n=1 Tax=Arundo donax TaxID=35708 RepID=A0A0A8YIU5_ARUDO